jgi:N-acetylmuramoyl-L-alanine amidase
VKIEVVFFRGTIAPCVIAEPFFIDNDKDLTRAQADIDGLVQAYADAIDEISEQVDL